MKKILQTLSVAKRTLSVLTYFILVSAASLITVNFASANLQQSFDTIKESVQGVKDSTTNLITTKDSNALSPEEKAQQELNQRLDIFAKILDLSIKEAEDTISQLKALNNLEERAISLREQFLGEFEGFLKFYNEQKDILGKPEEINLAKIKEMAQSFKDWRETNYNSELAAATAFLLINRQKATLEMAGNRFAKISSDVKKLKKANLEGVDGLEKLLNLAADSLKEAKDFYQKAKDGFWLIEEKLSVASSTLTGASTPITTSSTEKIIVPEISVSIENTSSTNSTSTPSISIEDQFLSIKGLVGNSLSKIKETYQIFIEMSNLVKKLLI
ncbi:MAG: hypothetical protein Q8N22_02305 [bacterium]|nr:hypothetical protein [bacterium]